MKKMRRLSRPQRDIRHLRKVGRILFQLRIPQDQSVAVQKTRFNTYFRYVFDPSPYRLSLNHVYFQPKIIGRHDYPAEAHIIRTDDGYLLEYHRIPHAKNAKASTQKYPSLLHHGLVDSSVDWVINGPDKSLAYRFADQGYDVWMANARGNTYSRSHISLNPASDKSFWDFT